MNLHELFDTPIDKPLSNVNHVALTYAQLHTLGAQGASAFYFLDLEKLRDNYHRLRQTFVSVYENSQIAYSFKTNYAPVIGRHLKDLGCWAEVVSAMEYHIATEVLGYPPDKVVVNGPLHESDFIEKILLDGANFNADAWYLLDMIGQISQRHPHRQFQIGIRLTYPIAEGGFSRFGISSDAESLQRLSEWQASHRNCRIRGLHSHFSNSSRSLASFADRINGLLAASDTLFPAAPPDFINIGGGFFGEMPQCLANQYAQTPDFSAYAQQIGSAMRARFGASSGVTLMLEPGTALIANAMVFACKVIEVKHVEGKTLALVNGSNHNINHKWAGEALPVQLISQHPQAGNAEFDIVGNTCIEKDVLRLGVQGNVAAGDYLVFQYMGGYTNVLKQPFIHPCQPIYCWQDKQLRIAKRQENINDILATYVL
ncbi:hypothetical protein ACO0LM_01655 [Undibacterium sp. Di26W]|uniref:hypothetical protein n=1 Tax=Undibacterium sp. Di26W TaxID=3413035 RepID=UPI003BF1F157